MLTVVIVRYYTTDLEISTDVVQVVIGAPDESLNELVVRAGARAKELSALDYTHLAYDVDVPEMDTLV